MAIGKFTHTIAQIDAAVDSINDVAQRIGVSAIVPCTQEQYDAIAEKSSTTLYVVYGLTKFAMYYGTRSLSGAGGSDTNGRAVGNVYGVASSLSGEPVYQGG